MRYTMRIFSGILVAMVGSTFAQSPTLIVAPKHGEYMSGDPVGGLDPADGEIILDQLCAFDHPWELGFGDACGGWLLFGIEYDLQAADDFELFEPATLTGFVCDYLQLTGESASSVCISVFAGACDFAEETPLFYIETAPDAVIPLSSPYGYYDENRYVVKQELCDLSAGRYYITMNPKMGDWGYAAGIGPHDDCGDFTCDVLLRDGEDDNPCCSGIPGFGYPDWTPSRNSWGWNTVMSCQVQVRFGPPAPRCIYTVTKAKPMTNLCGQVCDACTYRRGDLICANACLNGEDECVAVLTGISGCANGAACKIVADFIACAEAPRNCNSCQGGILGDPPKAECRVLDEYGKNDRINGTYDKNYDHPIVFEEYVGEDHWLHVGADAVRNNGEFTWKAPNGMGNGAMIRPRQGMRIGRAIKPKTLPTCN